MKEFALKGKGSFDDLFGELCFCLMTANFNAERSIRIQKELKDAFHKLSLKQLSKRLKELGHRFPNTRAKFIVEARKHKKELLNILNGIKEDSLIREWLAKNVKGLGLKESSHFLRNIGRNNCAIIDFHIVDILNEHKLIKNFKTMSKKKYIEVEEILNELANKLDMSLGELDLYLWYLETGKVLK